MAGRAVRVKPVIAPPERGDPSGRVASGRVATRAPLSVVVPTLNAAEGIGPTLAALASGVSAGLVRELVLADGGSSDDIARIAEEVGAELVVADPGRGMQLGAGGARARGDWILFLHADSAPDPCWIEETRSHLDERPAQAACFRLRFDAKGVGPAVVSAWANFRTRAFGLPYGDQGLLVPRALYHDVGGYPPIPIMEDVAIARRIGRRRIRVLDCGMVTDFSRYRREGWIRRGSRNLYCVFLFFLGVNPARIRSVYQGYR